MFKDIITSNDSTHTSGNDTQETVGHATNLATAIESTVRITAHTISRDIFNPKEIDNQNKGVGTGFFINRNGYILTCYHVIEDSVTIFINISQNGKRSYRADIVSIYPEMDIAVLKIRDYKNRYYLKLGDSDICEIGSDTVAIGYQLGDDTTKTTKGIISGVKDHLIHTDTTINEGNSGGALLLSNFEVIGINSSKMTGDNVEGIGYSTPINFFKAVQDVMMADGSDNPIVVYRPNLYCRFQTLEPDASKIICSEYYSKHNLKELIEGYMLIHQYQESPLLKCDQPMKLFDILVEIDGLKVDMYGDVDTDTMMGKINVNDYVLRCSMNTPVPITYFSVEKQDMVKTTIIFNNKYHYKIRNLFHPKNIDFVEVAGIIVSELTLDHVISVVNGKSHTTMINLVHMHTYLLVENREQPKIFISRILPISAHIDNKNLENSELSVIKRINGSYVSTIKEFVDICEKEPIIVDGRQYVHIEMANKERITLCIN